MNDANRFIESILAKRDPFFANLPIIRIITKIERPLVCASNLPKYTCVCSLFFLTYAEKLHCLACQRAYNLSLSSSDNIELIYPSSFWDLKPPSQSLNFVY